MLFISLCENTMESDSYIVISLFVLSYLMGNISIKLFFELCLICTLPVELFASTKLTCKFTVEFIM